MNLDFVYVRYINLDRRLDRNEDTFKKINEVLGFDKNNIKRFSAIDGTNLIQDLKNKNYIGDEFISIIKKLNLTLKSPELACLLSHYFLLKEILEDNTIPDDSIVVLFEDDFFINTQYLEKIKLSDIIGKIKSPVNFNNNNWDIIYLGGRFTQNFIPYNKSFFTHSFDNFYLRIAGCGMDWDRTTHNYLVKKKNIPNIISCYLNYYTYNFKPEFQVDSFYNSCSNKIKMYDYFPHIFYSPLNYSSDIQKIKIFINTKNIK